MDLAKELNEALFNIGSDTDRECVRIAFKGKKYGDIEQDLGGMCRQSMERWFRETLDRLLRDKSHLDQFEDRCSESCDKTTEDSTK